jgi:hypothetical protein
MTIVVTSQYFAAGGCCTTQMRNQCDIALMWECRFARLRKAYWEAFGTYFARQEGFDALLDEATKEKYAALVYNAYAKTQDEINFSWIAPPLPEFEMKFKAV